jgi:hypothetical protein
MIAFDPATPRLLLVGTNGAGVNELRLPAPHGDRGAVSPVQGQSKAAVSVVVTLVVFKGFW